MVKGLTLDLAPRRITVNNVQPGPTDTEMNAGALEYMSERSPIKRVAGPGSSYMTGSSLTINGGWVL